MPRAGSRWAAGSANRLAGIVANPPVSEVLDAHPKSKAWLLMMLLVYEFVVGGSAAADAPTIATPQHFGEIRALIPTRYAI
jgi:hypothetical protein